MKLRNFKHANVAPDGKIKTGGEVIVHAGIYKSTNGNCGIEGCHCCDDNWICISVGYDKSEKTVCGTSIEFDNKEELDNLLANPDAVNALSIIGLNDKVFAVVKDKWASFLSDVKEEAELYGYEDEDDLR